MTYRISAYGSNLNAARNPNSDYGWQGYQWPAGVPASLLGTLRYDGRKGTIVIVARRDLLPLVGTLMDATEAMGYFFVPGWCWSYSNRAITGTRIPSNHSRGKAIDINAPVNPYKTAATLTSDIPPAVVALWERHGFYWGGWYGDAMHMEYCYPPSSVAGHLKSAQAALAELEDDMPYTKKELTAIVSDAVAKALEAERAQTTKLVKAEVSAAITATNRSGSRPMRLPTSSAEATRGSTPSRETL